MVPAFRTVGFSAYMYMYIYIQTYSCMYLAMIHVGASRYGWKASGSITPPWESKSRAHGRQNFGSAIFHIERSF